jgi:hypothetical protein
VAEFPVVVDLGEAQIFEWHVAQATHGTVDIYFTLPDLLEERSQLILVHEDHNNRPASDAPGIAFSNTIY